MAINIDGIVNVKISLESPAVAGNSYSGGLIVGYPPAEGTVEGFAEYASLTEIADIGYKSTDAVYKAASVWFSQDPQPSNVYVATIMADTESGGTFEEPVAAIKRAQNYSGWYGIMPAGISHDEYSDMSIYVETTEKIMCYTLEAGEDLAASKIAYNRTFVERLASNQYEEADKYQHVAHMAKCFNYDPGEETWVFKSLSGITVGSFTSTQGTTMETANENYFVEIAGSKVTQGGKVLSGEWIDIIRFRDWLKNDIELRVLNLFVVNPKVAYTDGGISLIDNAMKASLRTGQQKGGIAEDSFDENGSKIAGFTTTVPLAASLTSEQKKSRNLPGCTFTAILAGAIHATEINGSLGY